MRGTSGVSVVIEGSTIGSHLERCVNIAGDGSELGLSGSTLEVFRKDGIGVGVSAGAHVALRGTTITGHADSLTYGIKCDGSLEKTFADLDGVTISDQKYGIYSTNNTL